MAHDSPLILQSDRSILLHTDSPEFAAARDRLSVFAELVKSPEYVHTYRLTPLSLWNAAACGVTCDTVLETLQQFSRYPVPENIIHEIRDYMNRFGLLWLETGSEGDIVFLKPSCPADLQRQILYD